MTKDELDALPRTLPEKPEGWSRTMIMHLNRGAQGASGVYEIKDDQGRVMPFQYCYQTGKKQKTEWSGFFIAGSQDPISWAELRKRWPLYLKQLARVIASGKDPMHDLTDEKPMPMYVIYDRPSDHPDGFVVREWFVCPGKLLPSTLMGEATASLEDARKLVPQGLVNIGRQEGDDAKIVEVWV